MARRGEVKKKKVKGANSVQDGKTIHTGWGRPRGSIVCSIPRGKLWLQYLLMGAGCQQASCWGGRLPRSGPPVSPRGGRAKGLSWPDVSPAPKGKISQASDSRHSLPLLVSSSFVAQMPHHHQRQRAGSHCRRHIVTGDADPRSGRAGKLCVVSRSLVAEISLRCKSHACPPKRRVSDPTT